MIKVYALCAFPPSLSSKLIILYALDLNSECTYDCLSLFLDMFDSMPEQSPTTESKAATTPSVDLFGAGTGADIHFSVWNLFHLLWFPYVHSSVDCFFFYFFIFTCWFVPHSGMRIVHVPTCSVLDCRSRSCSCFLSSTCHANAFLCSPPLQPPRFSSFSYSASRLHW